MNTNTNKKTMYEVLGVAPTATTEEIKAAHRRLTFEVLTGKTGLSREDADFRLKLLDMAFGTLADPAFRDAYDAKLAPTVLPQTTPYLPVKSEITEARALQLATGVVEDNQKTALAALGSQLPMDVLTTTVKASARSLSTILRIIIGLVILFIVMKLGQMAMSRTGQSRTPQMIRAEDMLVIQEYYKKYGVRPASRAEAEMLTNKKRLEEHEQRVVDFEEKKREDELRRFAAESREIGERVHRNVAYAEEQARYEERARQAELQRIRESQIEPEKYGQSDRSEEE